MDLRSALRDLQVRMQGRSQVLTVLVAREQATHFVDRNVQLPQGTDQLRCPDLVAPKAAVAAVIDGDVNDMS